MICDIISQLKIVCDRVLENYKCTGHLQSAVKSTVRHKSVFFPTLKLSVIQLRH